MNRRKVPWVRGLLSLIELSGGMGLYRVILYGQPTIGGVCKRVISLFLPFPTPSETNVDLSVGEFRRRRVSADLV